MNVDDYSFNWTSANQRFNITLKAFAEYSCIRNLNKVNINVTFNRAVQPYLEGTSLLPLKVAGFDEQPILPANDRQRYFERPFGVRVLSNRKLRNFHKLVRF